MIDAPRAYLYRYSDPFTGKPVWRRDGELWNGQRPAETIPLYEHPAPTASDIRNQALEEAAMVAESRVHSGTGKAAAIHIRALKTSAKPEGG